MQKINKSKENSNKNLTNSNGGTLSQTMIKTPLMQKEKAQFDMMNNSSLMQKMEARHNEIFGDTIQKRNNTGIPDNLKSGMENLSGMNLDDVKVHYNSPKPKAVQAYAFAQGNEIHIASGQEKHLPHELGHVVQQAKGMVKPTASVGGVAVNDSPKLESEATKMGERAMQMKANAGLEKDALKSNVDSIVQRNLVGTQQPYQLFRWKWTGDDWVLLDKIGKKKQMPDKPKIIPGKGKHVNEIWDDSYHNWEEQKEEYIGKSKVEKSKGGKSKGKWEEEEKVKEKTGGFIPHKGKHIQGMPPFDASKYYGDVPTVIKLEEIAMSNGIKLKYTGEHIHFFKKTIGYDAYDGVDTRAVRIDGDHGHPITEIAKIKTSFLSYVKKDILLSIENKDIDNIKVIRDYLIKNNADTIIPHFKKYFDKYLEKDSDEEEK